MFVDGVGDMLRIDADGIDSELHSGDMRAHIGGGVFISPTVDIFLCDGDDFRARQT